jgi:hypothetical protein
MARITMEKALAATSVGVIDVLGEKYLSKYNLGPISAPDALRLGIATASFLINYMDYEREFSEAIFYASLPGVVKAASNIAQKATQKTEAQRVVVIEHTTPTVSVTPPEITVEAKPAEVVGAPVPP